MGPRILNDVLRTIVNAEKRGKATANLQPISTVMVSFLNFMKIRGYIKDFQFSIEHLANEEKVQWWGLRCRDHNCIS
ncbi:40S ribosomal protein [Musa troglodytarum]|uniref:Small ribosomal subunit protein uS8c n=1 Tax=Musa troglodytarum TaxID=320322 RepID=A0A9E7K247_9LILI|nr:40S ribosomal protein [Musa troglodytarum]